MSKQVRETIGKQEEDLAFAAISGLPDSKIYRNLYIPCGGKTAEIDLLVLCSKGIFALEVKGFGSGSVITGSIIRYEWTRRWRKQKSRDAESTKFYNPIRQSDMHLKVIARYLGVPMDHCRGLVVFSDRAILKKVPRVTETCTVLQTRFLSSYFKRCLQQRKPRFSPAEFHRLETRLNALPRANDGMKRRHIQQVKEAERNRKAEQARRRASRKRP